MTIVAITATRDRLLVASDTLLYTWGGDVLYTPAGRHLEETKVRALAHAHAVLLVRGSSDLGDYIHAQARRFHDVESAAEVLPELLREAAQRIDLGGTYKGRSRGHEVFLGGWSRRRGCCAVVTAASRSGFVPRVDYSDREGQTGSWFDPYCREPFDLTPRDPAGMLGFVRLQLARKRASEPDVPYGGRLIVAELTEHATTLRDMGDIGLPPRRGEIAQFGAEAMCIAADAVTYGQASDSGYGIATIAGDSAAASRSDYTYKTLSGNAVEVTFTGSGNGPVRLTCVGGGIELDTESTNSPTVAGLAMELRDDTTPLKTAATLAPLQSIVGGVANNDGGGHGTYNFLHGRGSLSLTHEMAAFTGSKTFRVKFGYNLLDASGAPVAPGSVSYKNSLQVTDATLVVREFKR